MLCNNVTFSLRANISHSVPYIVVSGNHSDKTSPKMGGQALWSITFILEVSKGAKIGN